MARGTTIGCKRKVRNKVRLEKKGSDESDEDYKVSEDEELDESEDEYCSSLVGDESEESLGEYIDDEEDEEEEAWIRKKAKKVGRPKTRNGGQVKKKKKKKKNSKVVRSTKRKVTLKDEEEEDDNYEGDSDFCDVKQQKKNKAFNRKEEDGDDDDILSEEEDEFLDEMPKKRSKVSRSKASRNSGYRNLRKKNKITVREENEDCDYDDEDHVEFTPGDALERVPRRMRAKKHVVKRQNISDTSKELKDDKSVTVMKKKRTGRGGGRRRKYTVNSDSDVASSGSSDYEYTISEEEREQVREGNELCRGRTIGLRSSSPLRMNNEEAQTKLPAKKGKAKVSEVKVELVKQVCGICLSEEGKRTVRGVLNCCSHHFCFPCIMEWSKVESRCPLCKQRFTLINRKVRSDGTHDLRDAVFHVPERDQVYQPSEEELRGYLDPYESVLCTECHLGGDDALMLLCDLCDSPAHTYCVGLGHEVPEGNWYCEGCRPAAANASSNLQAMNFTSHDHGTVDNFTINSSSPIPAVREAFDLNEAYVPETPLTQSSGFSQSPRTTFIGDRQSYPSLPPGYAALTVFERRRIQRQIQQFLGRRLERNGSPAHAVQGINLFGSRIGPSRTAVMTQQPNVSFMPQNINIQGRSEYDSSSFCAREAASSSSSRQSSMRGQGNVASAPVNISYGIGGGFVHHHQVHPCHSGISSNNGSEVREGTVPSRTLQGPVYTHHF